MQAVILGGGKGTRLRERLGELPKPMVDMCGKPLLERQVELLRSHKFHDILLLLGYNPRSIMDYFGDGAKFGVRIRYAVEQSPLGSAGAVLDAFNQLEDQILILYGDTALNVDLKRFWSLHSAKGADASLFVHPNDHPHDSDLVEADDSGKILAFHSYPRQPGRNYANLVNAALYVMRKEALGRWRTLKPPLDFGRELFPLMAQAGQNLVAYRSREYIKDVGTPERLESAENDLRSGRIPSASFATPARAVFLDRDGTINEEVNRVSDPAQFKLLPGVAPAIRKLNRSGYVVVVVTNQPVIARGDCTEETLREINNKMETQLGEAGAYIDAIYYCPHHPDKGFPGERSELKFVCSCRKPAPGLVDAACRDMNLDRGSSWLIGDSDVDVKTAMRAGIRSVLVETGHVGRDGMHDCVPDHRFPSLTEAVDFLLGRCARE
jgi:histidinol-phosphate phosphatase family protein